MFDQTKITTDHSVIRKWFEERGGIPVARVGKSPPVEDAGVLQVYFDNASIPDNVQRISWEDFFTRFDQANLALLFEDGDGKNRFFKFISQDCE